MGILLGRRSERSHKKYVNRDFKERIKRSQALKIYFSILTPEIAIEATPIYEINKSKKKASRPENTTLENVLIKLKTEETVRSCYLDGSWNRI